jgi:hypothetical protein
MFDGGGRKKGAGEMTAKLTRIAMTALILVLAGPRCGALAVPTEVDQRMLDMRQKFPANSFVMMEAKVFRSG